MVRQVVKVVTARVMIRSEGTPMLLEEAVCSAQFFFLRLSPVTKRSVVMDRSGGKKSISAKKEEAAEYYNSTNSTLRLSNNSVKSDSSLFVNKGS